MTSFPRSLHLIIFFLYISVVKGYKFKTLFGLPCGNKPQQKNVSVDVSLQSEERGDFFYITHSLLLV